jgi:DNA (cytosine-5)-methyltransferase 1
MFNYKWYLKDGYIKKNKINCFGTFVCAGGSSMGYKLAGFNHLGGVELTEHYSKLYIKNHNPKIFYTQDIREFNKRDDLPKELYELDLLDGSPPCSSFSTSGAREKLWGKEKKYENKIQKTDDLVFEFYKTIDKLKPKSFLMENVSGLIKGNTKGYVKEIFKIIDKIGYKAQIFSLNSATMGVPQMRQRVFIIGHKKELNLKPLVLNFNEKKINFKEATEEFWNDTDGSCIKKYSIYKQWIETEIGSCHIKRFNLCKPALDRPCFTLTEMCSNACAASVCHPIFPRKLNKREGCAIQSFPLDYDFLDQSPLSCIGRSVPPVMMAQIANQMYNQWFK